MESTILRTFKILKSTQQKLSLFISWFFTALVVSGLIWVAWSQFRGVPIGIDKSTSELEPQKVEQVAQDVPQEIFLPTFKNDTSSYGIQRMAILRTDTTNRTKYEVEIYTVEKGDSIFKISKQFNIQPETILWANPKTLNDNPELLTIGMKLHIPASDGIYYQWKAGDTVAGVAARFKVEPSAILLWPENQLDISAPTINPGSYVMVPGGKREMISWVMPTIPRGKSGVSKSLAGPGACDTTDGAYGTGTFVWPAVNQVLSGNDYWSGHLALDIASNMGSPVFASDSGLVVYAGWNNSGYGYMVMIDHGNGYQTLYAHMSQVSVSCGSSVYQGSAIGSSGSSGNSTGPHLHFETRYLGGLVNPWSLMP